MTSSQHSSSSCASACGPWCLVPSLPPHLSVVVPRRVLHALAPELLGRLVPQVPDDLVRALAQVRREGMAIVAPASDPTTRALISFR
jgi:hypothetical protein